MDEFLGIGGNPPDRHVFGDQASETPGGAVPDGQPWHDARTGAARVVRTAAGQGVRPRRACYARHQRIGSVGRGPEGAGGGSRASHPHRARARGPRRAIKRRRTAKGQQPAGSDRCAASRSGCGRVGDRRSATHSRRCAAQRSRSDRMRRGTSSGRCAMAELSRLARMREAWSGGAPVAPLRKK